MNELPGDGRPASRGLGLPGAGASRSPAATAGGGPAPECLGPFPAGAAPGRAGDHAEGRC
nr:hypothetical protein StreXyl84_72860 [Streptomyces sp. Xyl84]